MKLRIKHEGLEVEFEATYTCASLSYTSTVVQDWITEYLRILEATKHRGHK